ncbi:hypothetical protein B0I37DRAFT_357822 [Chaetomium sp. MPI-CAGE-AT-0009]|nr:hypothetical protein B0I37DRAFT_357822 [Chaetomium sp. MPI-CAGE-AT-0009]
MPHGPRPLLLPFLRPRQGGGGGDGGFEDREVVERRKADEARAFKANEAARIIRASCMAGARVRKREEGAKRIPGEHDGREVAGSASAHGGLGHRAVQARKLGQFTASIDPYPGLYWCLWDKDIPVGLEIKPAGELWEGGELERVARGLPCLAGA